MKGTVVYRWLGVLSICVAGALQAQMPMGEAEKAVVAQERQWLQSQKTNNVELLAPLLAEKFISTGMDGKLTNRAQSLAEAKATHWTRAEYENVEVVVYGDAAIATGVFMGAGTDSKGKPMDDVERFTDTWVKMPGGKWQCVASQGTAIKK
ncbi:MAG: nuclear transport factor 2 family protein [Gammaproteobacteria bacterium]|nr:nuclear transport factor 2 family protein [Gammaproteobacteria bacterium]